MSLEDNQKRIFIAVKFYPDSVFRAMLSEIKERLKNEKIRWVKPENLHITLRYIGEYDIKRIPDIGHALSDLAGKLSDFDLIYKSTGVFRSISYPKVLWIGVERNQSLEDMQQQTDDALNRLGFDFNSSKYSPHLTIGRMKFIKDKTNFKSVVDDFHDRVFMRQRVESIVLFESRLTPRGPEYTPLGEYFFSKSIS